MTATGFIHLVALALLGAAHGGGLNTTQSFHHHHHQHNDVPKLAVIVSTARGASTETAEALGAHPCAVSLNEMLGGHTWTPTGYERYRPKTNLLHELHLGRGLKHSRWLADALYVRERFCALRPQEVKESCDSACLVVFKMHLDGYIEDANDGPWETLITSEDVAAIVVQRDAMENYCSMRKAIERKDWGHTPGTHADQTPWNCRGKDEAAKKQYVTNVPKKFNATRESLERASRPWLEIPFATYVADPAAAEERMLDFVGLQLPPLRWRSTCTYSWCKEYSWGGGSQETPQQRSAGRP